MWPFNVMNQTEEPLNPYVIGNAVGNSSVFVGREDVLQKVRNVLQHQHQGAIVLYGQRRIGKTSILKELEAKLAQAGYLPIFFDLQYKGKFPLEQVNQELANKISDKLNSQSKLTLEGILSHWQSPKKLVILFDEFEAFAGNEFEERQASEAFFPYWRDILAKVDKAKLNFVFTLGRKVEDLNLKAMSLLKAIPSTRVSLLCEEATRQLIRLSDSENNKTLNWDEEAIKTVWTQTGGHPFITQILCYCIWEHFFNEKKPHSKPKVRVTDVKANLANALETGENPFQWLWDGLPPTEKLVTSILAKAGNKPITAQTLEKRLKDSGLRIGTGDRQKATDVLKDWDVIENIPGGKFRFRVELFRHWIAKNKSLTKVQLELDGSEIRANNFYQASKHLAATNQLEAAIDNLEKALKLNPNHIGANASLTEAYLETQNWEKAWKTAKAFSLLRPQFARSLLSQALEGVIAGQNEDTQLHYYEETLKIDPEHSRIKQQWQKILTRKGDAVYKAGKLNEALEAYQKAESDDKVAMVEGDIAYQAGDLEKALKAYRKTGLNDKVASVEKALWQQKGDVAYQAGDFEQALEAYQKAGLADKIALVAGDIAYQAGDLEKALGYYKDAKSDDKIAEIEQLQMAQSQIGSYLNELVEQSKGIDAILLYDAKHNKVYHNPNSVVESHSLLALKIVFQNLLSSVENLSQMTYPGKFQHAIFPFVNEGSIYVYFVNELPCMIGIVSNANMGIAISENRKLLKRLMEQKEKISTFFS